jgi:hypothetical protein
LLGITLTQTELSELKHVFSEKRHEEFCGHLMPVRNMLCKRPPCPLFSVVLPDHAEGDRAAA